MHDEATEIRYKDSPLYWRFNAERRFLRSSYLMDDLLREHNERFFFLTAQNCRICYDAWVSCIMYRLGQHERWMYIGMPTVICDAMAKASVPRTDSENAFAAIPACCILHPPTLGCAGAEASRQQQLWQRK